MPLVSDHFLFAFSIKMPPIEFSCFKLWLRENFRSRETQKVKGEKSLEMSKMSSNGFA